MPYEASKNELEVLEFWQKDKIFEKSVSKRPVEKPYVFYDGPPFATGLPHYGHIVASLMKDIVPRFWTMNGYRVERRWGWDCHGLPIENIIEQELKLGTKRDIEEFGVAKFNEACRATVLKYASEWKKFIPRMGRWVDMENDYKTMDIEFMESVWWVFKELWNKDLIYEGHKAMHICPRCVTPLSNFEVTQGYKDIKDISVTVKFRLKDTGDRKINVIFNVDKPVYILAWTTTPWTLPGNVLLAVNSDIDYVLTKIHFNNKEPEYCVIARERIETLKNAIDYKNHEIINDHKGFGLRGLEYEPLFPYYANTSNAFKVVAADFVSTTDGTGVVHIAPAFGEDDYNVGKREKVPLVQHVGMDGKFKAEVADFAGQDVKPKDDPSRADVEVLKKLSKEGKLFSKESVTHSYPHCWRCDTPLLNYATSSWFVSVTHVKEDMLKNNQAVHWVPESVKDGRFGKWLEGAHDWAISRNRFWGTPLPVWRCESEAKQGKNNNPKCRNVVVGSVAELEKLCGQKVTDLHKHIVDELVLTCPDCGGKMKRIPEVLDCWFESGSMPYGQMHYPFENKKKFEGGFPAEFIAEGQDQTRGWFYTLHVLATALTRGAKPSVPKENSVPAFKNVVVNGIVLAEDGRKMSKKLKNYPDPTLVLEKYGADAMRYYLASSPVMYAEALNFSEAGVREMYNKVVNTLWNVYTFYEMFAAESGSGKVHSQNVLDKWIMAKLQLLLQEVTSKIREYRLAEAARPVLEFITELSQWYVRRSRDRFKGEDVTDKQAALSTLREVLLTLSKVMAPFTPFIAEKIFKLISGKESVHLEMWPEVDESLLDEKVLKEMAGVRKVVEMGLALRAESGVKVRQALGDLQVAGSVFSKDLSQIIAEELNVKAVENTKELSVGNNWRVKEDGELKVALNIEITAELKKEGLVREIVRTINQIRKEQKMTIQDRVFVEFGTKDEMLSEVFKSFEEEIKASVLATELKTGDSGSEVEIDGRKLLLSVKK